MVLPPKSSHPLGEETSAVKKVLPEAVEVETYAGKLHIECRKKVPEGNAAYLS